MGDKRSWKTRGWEAERERKEDLSTDEIPLKE